MNIETFLPIVGRRVRKQFALGLIMSFLLARNLMAVVDTGAIRIEEAQRAFQERYQMTVDPAGVTWPVRNSDGADPGLYPPGGFYGPDLSNNVLAASLVADLAGKFNRNSYTSILWYYLDPDQQPNGDIEGVDWPTYCAYTTTLPTVGDITTANYSHIFGQITKEICRLKYAVVWASQVGSSGTADSQVETRLGQVIDETHGTEHLLFPSGPGDCGTFSALWDYPPVSTDKLQVLIDYASSTGEGSLGSVKITGNSIPAGTPIPSSDVQIDSLGFATRLQTCSVDGGNLYARLQWSSKNGVDCQTDKSLAPGAWDQDQWTPGRDLWIGQIERVVTNSFTIFTQSFETNNVYEEYQSHLMVGASLRSIRGRIYADLRSFSGSARCYADVWWQGDEPSNDPPVPGEFEYHFVETATPGGEWASRVLGDFKPSFTLDCPAGEADLYRGWLLLDALIVVTPNFQNNIEDCEPCSACSGDSCTPGSSSASLTSDGALSVNIDLGLDSFGKSAGQLNLGASRPNPGLFSPSALSYHTSAGSEVLRGIDGVIRQVRTAQALTDIVPISSAKYEVRSYTSANAGGKDGSGFYAPTGSPYTTITVENPDSSGNTFNQLRVTETTSGEDAKVSDFEWVEAEQKWKLTTGGGLRQEERTSIWDEWHWQRTDTHTIKNGNGEVAYKERQTFEAFGWGAELIEKVVDPDGAALTTTYSYYDDQWNDGDNYTHLKQMVEPNGHWESYAYDSLGQQTKVVSQYKDAPVGATEDECHVTTTIYGTNDPAVTVIETIQGNEVSRRYTAYRPGETREIQAQTPGAAWDDPANLVTVTRTYLGGPFEGKVQSVTRPDGTMNIYQYEYAASDGGSNLITTVSTGQPNSDGSAIVDGTEAVTVVDNAGNTISSVTHDIVSGLVLSQAVTTQTDDFGRPTAVVSLDGTNTTTYGCCGVQSTTDAEGITTSYTYDALKRLTATTRAGITTTNSLDAAGHVLSTVRIGSDNSAITLNTSTYDVAGRLTSSTDALTNTTSYAETIDGNGHLVKTTTYADNSTRIGTYYQDGQLLSVTGTTVHGVRYEYGADGDGQWTKEIRLTTQGTETTEWTKTYTDLVGRPSLVAYSDGASSHSYYNNKGQLVKQVDPDGVTMLYAYNAKGELETIAIDMDRNDVIDYNGTDRISRSQRSVISDQGIVKQRTTTTVWTADNADVAETVSLNNVSADGLQSWNISYGLTNTVAAVYDRPNASRTVTTTNPDGSYSVAQYTNGRSQSQTLRNSQSAILQSTTYQYDPLGRPSLVAQASLPVDVLTAYSYNAADQLIAVTNAVGMANQQVTRYQYDSMGRVTVTTLPDNGTVTTEYFDTGEPKKTWGARTYPVEYTYDYGGRLKTMKTWKDYAGNMGAATTTWNYDSQRGLLVSKVYPSPQGGEGQGEGPSYTYTVAVRLLSRTWARDITTTYGYNNAGDLASISYDDGITLSVAAVYDRRGRRVAVTNGTSVVQYSYNSAGQLLTESFPNSGVIVTNTYDSLLRRTSLSGATVSVAYSYDSASRLSSVSDGMHSAIYSYLANSPLVSNIVFQTGGVTKMTTTKSYDNLNRLTSISSSAGVSPVSSHSYQYNNANQRTRVDLAEPAGGGASGSYWLYQYDALGQVTSGKKYWSDGTEVAGQQFGYDFDDIGNRKSANHSGAGVPPAAVSEYTANALNQYTQHTVPGTMDILGTAHSNATVTVNNQPTTRKGDYWYRQLTVTNTAAAQYPIVRAVGVLPGATTNGADIVTTTTGHVFVAQSPELFGYDSDGNLTNDGRWAYTWDAESRLISMQTLEGVAPATPRQKLSFTYDSQSRRISKVVSNFDGSVWSLASNLEFVYDGWNLVAEVGTSGSLVRSYTWGLDLSGSMQGAGGIGGLLAVTTHPAGGGTSFVSCDGNGNVAALLNADSGSLTATYEYGPFGDTVRATGDSAASNPFRFSTKYTDVETAQLYYGYRYYSPSTGRWLSCDPIEEDGGPNLYGFVGNNPNDYFDVLGLWRSGEHSDITKAAWDNGGIPEGAKKYATIYDTLVDANIAVDSGASADDLKQHYNRALKGGIADARLDYSKNLKSKQDSFDNLLKKPSKTSCELAFKTLGQLTHSWEDYFAHAIRLASTSGKDDPGPIEGDPDAPSTNLKPSSWGGLTSWGEHGFKEPAWREKDGGADRKKRATDFVAGKFKVEMPTWWDKCRCYYESK